MAHLLNSGRVIIDTAFQSGRIRSDDTRNTIKTADIKILDLKPEAMLYYPRTCNRVQAPGLFGKKHTENTGK
ncbi:MAG: hypothetical protein ABII68_12220, partial [Pseudomonadota bacterium]